jgi:hypothetical protein
MSLPPTTPAHLSGLALDGDDFTPAQIARRFENEAEAYYDLGGESQAPGS